MSMAGMLAARAVLDRTGRGSRPRLGALWSPLMFRRRRRDATIDPLAHVDPAAVPRRYAGHVTSALETRRRWQQLTASMREGAVQARLIGFGAQVDAGVLAVWDTVQRMAEIERVVAMLDIDRVTAELKQVRRDPAADPAMVEALNARFTSVQ